MKITLVTTAVVLTLGLTSASATLLVDVDGNSGNTVGGSTFTYEANEGGGGMPNVGGRLKSVTLIGDDREAITGTDTNKVDYYLHWNSISGDALDASTYKYAKIEYTLEGDWVAGEHKFRLGDTVSVTGSAGANDAFSNPGLLDTVAARADGTHSFIVDLTADVVYDGDWKYLRWNFYNHSDNTSSVDTSNEQKLTIDKITYATALTPIPEPTTMGLLSLGALAFVVRRFRK